MIRIAICDDEKEMLEELKKNLSAYFDRHSEIPVKISAFSSAGALISAVQTSGSFDIYILDVIMPDMNGIDLGIRLRQSGDRGVIIYLTSSPEYAVDSYNTEAFFYLLKPLDPERLNSILSHAADCIEKRKQQGITVKNSDGITFLPFDSILYAELKKRSIYYYLSDGSCIKSQCLRLSFKTACEKLLCDKRFALCGASFCINLSFVKSLEKTHAVFKNGCKLLLPAKAIANMRTQWLDFWLEESP